MPRKVEILAEAAAETFEARVFYENRDEKIAADFLSELDTAIAAISDRPDRWAIYRRETRSYLLRRFPCRVFI